MVITEIDRQAARKAQETERQKSKMSDKNAARLRLLNEAEKAARDANRKFVAEFDRLPKDTWTLAQLLTRLSNDRRWLYKRANKLRQCLAKGWAPTSSHDVLFMSELTAEEVERSDEKFQALLTTGWSAPDRQAPEKKCKERCRCQVCNAKLEGRQTVICRRASCRAVLARARQSDRLQTPLAAPA